MLPTQLCTLALQNQAKLLFFPDLTVGRDDGLCSEVPSLTENSYSFFKTQIKCLISLHLCLPLPTRQSCGSLSGFPQTCPLEASRRQDQELRPPSYQKYPIQGQVLGAQEEQTGRTGYSQGHVQDLVGLWLPNPSEQLLKVGHEGNTRAYETGCF